VVRANLRGVFGKRANMFDCETILRGSPAGPIRSVEHRHAPYLPAKQTPAKCKMSTVDQTTNVPNKRLEACYAATELVLGWMFANLQDGDMYIKR
jgi:hypothetical protein